LSSLAKPGHPMSKFMWGNLKSLKPEGLTEREINAMLHTFKKKYYVATNMFLAVQSQEELDILEHWVKDSFSDVPKGDEIIDHKDIISQKMPFNNENWHKIYRLSPIQNTYQVHSG